MSDWVGCSERQSGPPVLREAVVSRLPEMGALAPGAWCCSSLEELGACTQTQTLYRKYPGSRIDPLPTRMVR